MAMNYRYSECGLDNVVIENMPVVIDDAGEEVYSIPNIVGLHKVIAYSIITQSYSIGPAELRFLRTEMGLTQAELGQLVKKDHQTIGRWERGEKPIDQNAESVIRLVAAERLEVETELSLEELVKRCVPTAKFQEITIDGSDPSNYQIAA